MPPHRIAIAGFQHETNTFGASLAGYREFEMADSWAAMLRGSDVISGTKGSTLPLAGFVAEAARRPDWEVLPILWCSAEPSAQVTDQAFDSILGDITSALKAMAPVDAVYLDLHGAMVTQSHQDGEGEILRQVREVIGLNTPLIISLDNHANLTKAMVDLSDGICLFRTYPHLDMDATGARAARALAPMLDGYRPAKAWRQSPYLIPLQAQYTGMEPCRQLYAELSVPAADTQPESVAWTDFALGFPSADIHDCGPSIVAYAQTQAMADKAAERLLDHVQKAEDKFEAKLWSPDEAAQFVLQSSQRVVLADVQDNAGAGSPSDTMGILEALLNVGARGAIVGMVNDPEVASLAHQAGAGQCITAKLGNKAMAELNPLNARFQILALSNGSFDFIGEMYRGSRAETGPTALLRIVHPQADVQVVVTSVRCQALDQACFRHLGVDLEAQKTIVVKSTVHFRADFDSLSSLILNVAAPSLTVCNLSDIPYRNLRPGVRIGPLGRSHLS